MDSAYYTAISPLYYSASENATLIRYSANYGNINFLKNAGADTITLGANLVVTGITASKNVNYLNVTNYGDINLVKIATGTYSLSVGGITSTLGTTTTISTTHYLKNGLNQGDITVSDITGTGNIYVGGLVVYNYAGNLQSQDASSQPIATAGIINSINYGSLSTSYSASYYGIDGTGNTFFGGIATLNLGSIQDCANLGALRAYNSNAGSVPTVTTPDTSQYYAGRIATYVAGITCGGVVAITLRGSARVYDCANNGDIVALSNYYTRAGGILATSLNSEAAAGSITVALGLDTTIATSIMSNGLNFGNVSAISSVISTYTPGTNADAANIAFYPYYGTGIQTRVVQYYYGTQQISSQERPTINSASGGVIGYGLCVMRRMMNHGTISSSDVAGGIVGATFVVGGSDAPVTTVNINTAINYGNIEAVDSASYASLDKVALSYSNISGYFLTGAARTTYIWGTNSNRLEPANRKGFGGVFGRLQRGNSGIMTSSGGSFDFVVNCDPDIDLIGRLDQVYNFSSSSRFFRFNNAIYYSARENDTTQVVFTGFYYCYGSAYRASTANPTTVYITPSNRFSQVGIVGTDLAGTYTTPYNQQGTGKYYNNANLSTTSGSPTTAIYAYQAPIDVPWITEDPDHLYFQSGQKYFGLESTYYIYDESFPMRTNAALTEYIYYMEYNLLAERFREVIDGGTGENPRPNGMYVLSTTAGSTVGAVLPSNLDSDELRPVNEDMTGQLSLLADYSALSHTYLSALDAGVTGAYDDLRQTIFNDKSALVENPTVSVTLTETGAGSSGTILANGVVDDMAHTITFEISMEAFLNGSVPVYYLVSYAETSASALIACRAIDYDGYTTLTAYNDLLSAEGADGISILYPPELTRTLPLKTITADTGALSLGYFTIYSEAFVGSDLFASASYFTDYQVFVNFTPSIAQAAGLLEIDTVEFNTSGTDLDVTNQATVAALGTVNTNGSITFNFIDTKGVLTEGQDLKTYVVVKYSDGTTVSSDYYTMTSELVTITTGTGRGSVTISFTGSTRYGDYRMYYKYFSSSTEYNVIFDKAASSAKLITGLSHYSISDSLSIVGTAITSSLNLGYGITLTSSGDPDNFSYSDNGALPSYVSSRTYTVNYNENFANTFSISPFAVLTNAYLSSTAYSNGYVVYTITYLITAEDGTQSTYTHTMTERTIDLTSVLKNGNEVGFGDVEAAREDLSTEFTIDLGLDQALDLYNLLITSYPYISMNVTWSGGTFDLVESEIAFSVGDYLLITMGDAAQPGDYTFTFYLHRDATNTVTLATTLVITKLEGTDSYLTDIRFSELANETEYPDIFIVDTTNTILSTPYQPAVYFSGIDYDGADAIQNYHYQVQGKVSNTPLNDFLPLMLDYLPPGATISRRYYVSGVETWTTPVQAGDAGAEASLATDFTLDPETGAELEEVYIAYRVTSEDGAHSTYYFVSVADVTFNLTLVFDIYYCTGVGEETCTLASESVDFTDQLVMMTVKNLVTDGEEAVGVVDPADYPLFTEITSLNNQVTQFYYTYSGDYQYSFGRNRSGFFNFEVSLPQDAYLNDIYEYEIHYGDYTLYDIADYVEGVDGKYFYIEYSNKNRTRRFNIYIREITTPSTDDPWGLYDFFVSWWD